MGQGSIFGVYFADEPPTSIRDVIASDRESAGIFYLGLLAHGVFITPYHLGFTNASQDQAEIDEILDTCQGVLTAIKEG